MPDQRDINKLLSETRKRISSNAFATQLEELLAGKRIHQAHVEAALNHIRCGQIGKARDILERALK